MKFILILVLNGNPSFANDGPFKTWMQCVSNGEAHMAMLANGRVGQTPVIQGGYACVSEAHGRTLFNRLIEQRLAELDEEEGHAL